MKKIMNWRTASLLIWTIITVVILLVMPDLDQLVREKGQIEIPSDSQSEVAKEMLKDMNGESGESYQIIVVYNSGNENALTAAQEEQIRAVIEELKDKKEQLGIIKILSHLDNEEVEKQLVSEDETTILTRLNVDGNEGTISEVSNRLNEIIAIEGIETYLTGNDLVIEDFVQSVEEGVKKTEIIAVVLIIIVLIIVFRSFIIPFVSLFTVGISYLVSLGVVAQLVDHFNYPFSNFTQIFLVVVLFGIGTDYNILLYTRFKEALSAHDDVLLAIKETFKTAGKTVLYSGVAVLIGFSVLILAKFQLYRSSSAVAIGIIVLLLALMTLSPFFMALLGKKLFYPVKELKGHSESRLWSFLAKNSVLRPFISLIFVAIVSIPFLISYSGTSNYDELVEVNDAFRSKQGINVIEEHFSAGFSSPATLVLQSEDKMDNQRSLQALDELADTISKVDGVSAVYSPTRPTGEKLEQLYLNDQTDELNSGLDSANEGIGELYEGLSSAEKEIGNRSNDFANVQKLIDGTNELKTGAQALEDALQAVTSGVKSGAEGAANIESGLGTVKENLSGLSVATTQLYTGYTDLENGLSAFGNAFSSMSQAIEGAKQGFEMIEGSMSSLITSNPSLASDPNVQKTIGIASTTKEQLGKLLDELTKLVPQYDTAMKSFAEANKALSTINGGLAQIEGGVGELQKGAASLTEGLNEGADGSSQIASHAGKLGDGLSQISDGQEQLLSGINTLQEKMGELQSGLSKSTEGLDEIREGLKDAQKYLGDLSSSEAAEKFYIPQDVLEGEEFQKGLDMYMSEDRKIAQLSIILDVNPYSEEAMTIIENIQQLVDSASHSDTLSDVKIALGGKSAQNVDLAEISSSDFLRTATIMLIGIGIVLIVITRSIAQPIYIIGSLILAYTASLGIGELVSKFVLGADHLGWNVPFFSFIMIVALGVDYSIFLMMRLRETEGDALTAIVDACRHIGSVVISAAVILGGTFAALIPSGILTLVQIAVVVIVGLILLSIIMLPILIPALNSITSKIIKTK